MRRLYNCIMALQQYYNKIENYPYIVKYQQCMASSTQPSSNLLTSVASDVQYSLSRCFINYAKDQLIHKEFALMMESSLLIETLGQNLAHQSKRSQDKDCSRIISNNTLDTLLTEEDELPRTRRPFARKTTHAPQRMLSSDHSLATALDEIKDNCSAKTFGAVSNLLEGYNRLRKTMNQSKAQLNVSGNAIVRPRPDTERSNSDQALILTTRNLKLEKEVGLLNQRIRQLEHKLAKLTENARKEPPPTLRMYLDNRQKQLQKYVERVEGFHGNIMAGLQGHLIDQGCSRCCVLVKKIKDSLIGYKLCLSEEMETYRGLWEKLHMGNQV